MNKLNQRIAEVEKEAEKTWNFHNSHNIMTSEPKGVMPVSQAKKLFKEISSLGKQAVEELEQMYKVRNDDAKDYAKVITELQEERKELLEKIKNEIEFLDKKLRNKNWFHPEVEEIIHNRILELKQQLNTQTEKK